MADYRAPTQEVKSVLADILDFTRLNKLDDFAEASDELVEAIVEQSAIFAQDVVAPTNTPGDLIGSKAVDGEVVTPDCFKEAYAQFVEGGWMSLAQSPEYGGQGMPFSLHMVTSEFWNSANMSFALCPMLSAGALDTLMAHANDDIKNKFLEKIVSGEWTASMNLTESHAGSDLSSLKTTATENGDHFLVRGQKIFITWGEHDMAENIVHIVLAPTSDAPKGIKGLSLFAVSKYLVNDDGSLGQRNDVKVVSTEHKLGIHGSPTCVMSFGEGEGAIGHMIGEPGQGLECMFTLMNHARLEVGLQGVGLSERSYQDALAYARERVQGRNAETGAPATIIEHADVQRCLMQMKSMTDSMRVLCYDAAFSHDLRGHADSEELRDYHSRRFALLTPITKAWCTELVNEVTSLGVQVHGGMGYIEETGVAQYYRDARITSIYEGTNAIQANDLVGRKLIKDNGAAFNELMAEIDLTLDAELSAEELSVMKGALSAAKSDVQSTAQFILHNADSSDHFVGAVAFNFLMQCGYVIGGWYQLRAAITASKNLSDKSGDLKYSTHKIAEAQFYIAQLLPRVYSYSKAVTQGASAGVSLNSESFL